jgi:hypothetical protein
MAKILVDYHAMIYCIECISRWIKVKIVISVCASIDKIIGLVSFYGKGSIVRHVQASSRSVNEIFAVLQFYAA